MVGKEERGYHIGSSEFAHPSSPSVGPERDEQIPMKQLPESEVYEKGLRYWPYRLSQEFVLNQIVNLAPRDGCLLDIMCGPGNLLGKIIEMRPDLKLIGVDIDQRYIQYGRQTYPQASFEEGDVLSWKQRATSDIVICTGAIHHIPYEFQEKAIANIATMLAPGTPAIISDCYIEEYEDETDRKLAAAKLGYEYLKATIQNGAPDDVISWTVDILWNDVFRKEYKPSLAQRVPILKKYFNEVKTVKTWPTGDATYGDYVHICLTH